MAIALATVVASTALATASPSDDLVQPVAPDHVAAPSRTTPNGRFDVGTTPVVGQTADPEAVIVELRSPALLRRPRLRAEGGLRLGSPHLAAARAEIEAEHSRAALAIRKVVEQHRGRPTSIGEIVRHEYSRVFNGYAAILSPSEQSEIRRLPEVLTIRPDTAVQAVLDTSPSVIRAPEFRTASGIDGTGVVVAVVDTGIDYTHADLGGCLGAACKVVGGYDFANNDADPADDHGHGTHVAGIVASTHPVLRGVAPGAKLLAYKVLNQYGSGLSSAIIAGIERAVDPNSNGDTSDHAGVINLSLGGPGDGDDPQSQAVDNAVAAGVVVVAAAGNDYGYWTIRSPGTARRAITVGATDDGDDHAAFSSKGPALPDYDLKPEVSAPGVSVCAPRAAGTSLGATCQDATHVAASGTSMATPHVAGAAALLRARYPGLDPDGIKSLIVNNAADVGLPISDDGAGRLDVVEAAGSATTLAPAAISFGLDDLAQTTWIEHRSLTVTNVSASTRSYSVASGTMPGGIVVSATPSSFALAAGVSTTIDIALSVDNTIVPRPAADPYTYTGRILVTSGADTQVVPFQFVDSPVLTLQFNETPRWIIVTDGTTVWWYAANLSTTQRLLLPPATYDVWTSFTSSWSPSAPSRLFALVVREDLALDDQRTESISSAEAIHTIDFANRDETGSFLGRGSQSIALHHSSGVAVHIFNDYASSSDWIQTNSISSQFDIELSWSMNRCGPGYYPVAGFPAPCISTTARDIDHFLLQHMIPTPIAGDVTVGNTAGDLSEFAVRYDARAGENNVAFCYTDWILAPDGAGLGTGGLVKGPAPSYRLFTTVAPRKPFHGFFESWTADLTQCTPGTTDCCADRLASLQKLQPGATSQSLEQYARRPSDGPIIVDTDADVPMGHAPAHFWLQTDNSSTNFALRTSGYLVDSRLGRPFLGQGTDAVQPGSGASAAWSLRSLATGAIAGSGSMPQAWDLPSSSLPALNLAAAGLHTLTVDSPAFPFGASGQTTTTRASLTFNTASASDPNPPWLRRLEVRQGGLASHHVSSAAALSIELELSDVDLDGPYSGLTSVEIVHPGAGGAVTTVPDDLGGGRYSLTLASCVVGPNQIVVRASDQAGNAMEQRLDPAFHCLGSCAPPASCTSTCGDGRVAIGEDCDDGDADSGDGCSSTCRTETGYSCSGEPSICIPSCGNGLVDPGELCDDNLGCCAADCTFVGAGTACASDGNVCTGDACDGFGACSHPPASIGTPCADDGEVCTDDRCSSSGACAHTPLPTGTSCPDEGNACTTDRCDSSGACAHTPAPVGTACADDGNTCTADRCDNSAACVHTPSPSGSPCADDGSPCTDDRCDGAASCAHPYNIAPCSDADACTIGDACSGGVCVPGAPANCDDLNPCTADSCDTASGCVALAQPVDAVLCHQAGRSSVMLRDEPGGRRDLLKWKWSKGAAFAQDVLGNPDVDTTYALCVFDTAGGVARLATSAAVEPSATFWESDAPDGWKYKDPSGSSSGVEKLSVKTGAEERTSVKLLARESPLPLTGPAGSSSYFDQDPSVLVQLVNDRGQCWMSEFRPAGTRENDATLFKAKAP